MLLFHCFVNPKGRCEQRVVASQEGFTRFGFVSPLLCSAGFGSLSRTGEGSKMTKGSQRTQYKAENLASSNKIQRSGSRSQEPTLTGCWLLQQEMCLYACGSVGA